jgi:hypothetical protein
MIVINVFSFGVRTGISIADLLNYASWEVGISFINIFLLNSIEKNIHEKRMTD